MALRLQIRKYVSSVNSQVPSHLPSHTPSLLHLSLQLPRHARGNHIPPAHRRRHSLDHRRTIACCENPLHGRLAENIRRLIVSLLRQLASQLRCKRAIDLRERPMHQEALCFLRAVFEVHDDVCAIGAFDELDDFAVVDFEFRGLFGCCCAHAGEQRGVGVRVDGHSGGELGGVVGDVHGGRDVRAGADGEDSGGGGAA